MTPAELLAAVAKWPEDRRADFEERAAILEEGCHLSREESEKRAYRMLAPRTQASLVWDL